MHIRCPHCRNAVELIPDDETTEVVCPSCRSKFSLDDMLSVKVSMTQTATELAKTLESGSILAQFEIKELLGRGGFGSVYSAFDKMLERDVALKIPRMEKMSEWHAAAFIREAQAAAQLRDPNIVAVHEVGRDHDQVFIVTDLIDGITLNEWRKQENPDAKKSAVMIAQIARAIHKAHERGVIHRDLKPRNVIVDFDGQPHITDFGLAKRENPEEITITTKGQVVGTPAYMSPEQAIGKSQHADRRTDVYSLGIMLYELLAGRRPYVGESDLLVNEVIDGKPEPIHTFNKKIHPDIEAITLKAMSRNVGERFSTAGEFAEDLERFVAGDPTLTRPPTPVQKFGRMARRNWLTISASTVFAGLTGGLLYSMTRPPEIVVAPEKKPFTLAVEFKVTPPRASVGIVKVDPRVGHIELDKVVTPSVSADGTTYSIELEPGWYIVEANLPGFGIQEVRRTVPVQTNAGQSEFRDNSDWTELEDQRRIRWPAINIIKTAESNDDGLFIFDDDVHLIRIQGGIFDASSSFAGVSNENMRRKDVEKQQVDYLIGEDKINVKQYNRVMNYGLTDRLGRPAPAEWPATNVTLYDVFEFCERTGTRPVTYDEYIFAATNGGTTKFPWGDAKRNWGENWGVVALGIEDENRNQPPVRNLYSQTLEWTMEFDMAINPKTNRPYDSFKIPDFLNPRFVVGGPAELTMRSFDNETPIENPVPSPRFFLELAPESRKEMLGFRVARSLTPRIVLTPSKVELKAEPNQR